MRGDAGRFSFDTRTDGGQARFPGLAEFWERALQGPNCGVFATAAIFLVGAVRLYPLDPATAGRARRARPPLLARRRHRRQRQLAAEIRIDFRRGFGTRNGSEERQFATVCGSIRSEPGPGRGGASMGACLVAAIIGLGGAEAKAARRGLIPKPADQDGGCRWRTCGATVHGAAAGGPAIRSHGGARAQAVVIANGRAGAAGTVGTSSVPPLNHGAATR